MMRTRKMLKRRRRGRIERRTRIRIRMIMVNLIRTTKIIRKIRTLQLARIKIKPTNKIDHRLIIIMVVLLLNRNL